MLFSVCFSDLWLVFYTRLFLSIYLIIGSHRNMWLYADKWALKPCVVVVHRGREEKSNRSSSCDNKKSTFTLIFAHFLRILLQLVQAGRQAIKSESLSSDNKQSRGEEEEEEETRSKTSSFQSIFSGDSSNWICETRKNFPPKITLDLCRPSKIPWLFMRLTRPKSWSPVINVISILLF